MAFRGTPNFGYKRANEASPIFQDTNTEIPASGNYYFNFDVHKSQQQKYLPFTLITITNSSNYRIKFYPNQGTNGNIVPPNSSKVFTKTSIPAVFAGRIENLDTSNAITAGLVSIEGQREQVDTSDIIKSAHQFFRGF